MLTALEQRSTGVKRDGSDGGDGMEARIARLEAHVEHIDKTLDEMKLDARELRAEVKEVRQEARTDFRLTFGALIAVAIGLAGMMAKGFGWLD